ncbi:glycosyltransferase family 39 protein [Xylophilus ampelinus]|uniref:glycosyltransferase family 39 protein n=1 Tax=Xylophilus ampelinus TaxID=54067 RepID=UPI00131425F9|nr:glycosyltransferase family 39 protein [Xylophilus ampelinus]MCS4510483.1 glycosyltransferase family 39 protein [Xylophilus ampelinus]
MSQRTEGAPANRTPVFATALIFLLILLGTYLRFHGIAGFSLWEDELFSVATAAQSGPWYGPVVPGKTMEQLQLADSFWTWKFADPHPPLYEMALVAWIWLFGVSDFAVRSLSAAFGVITMLSVFALPRSFAWPARAVYVALLAASGPLLIYSQDARGYSLAACLSAWMFVCMARQMHEDAAAIRAGRPSLALLLLGGLLGLTHYYGLLMVACIAAVMTLQVRSAAAFFAASWRWIVAVVPVLVYMGLGWMGILMKLGAVPPKALSWAMTFKRNTIAMLRNVDPGNVGSPSFWVFLLLAVVGLAIYLRMRRDRHALAPVVGALAVVMVLFFLMLVLGTRRAEFFSERYVIFMVPGCLLMVAAFTTVKGWPRAVSLMLVAALIPMGVRVWQLSPRPQNGGDWRGAAELVARAYRPGDLIVVALHDPTMRSHFQHYLRNHIPQEQLDQRLLTIVKPADIPARIAALGPTPPRIIVFSHSAFMTKFQAVLDVLQTQVGCRPAELQRAQALVIEVLPCGGS